VLAPREEEGKTETKGVETALKTLERLNALDAAEVYGVPNWSGGYFKVGKKGLLEATPHGSAKGAPLLKIMTTSWHALKACP
jgi:arginine decarboxylase-like protein